MTYAIEREIERFERFAGYDGLPVRVEALCAHGFLLKPRHSATALPPGKRIALTFMGITHGNEWGGIAVLNGLLAHLAAGVVQLEIPVAFLLGNPAAAREQRRFLDRDLNRSFARPETGSLREERRARELATVLDQTAYLVDFHQTARFTPQPFFIFPFMRASYEFARQVGFRHTVVTHWGKPFSAEGQCSDEYVNSKGGVGISCELGQNGFDLNQIGAGIDMGLWAIQSVTRRLQGGGVPAPAQHHPDEEGALYTWAGIVPWPEAQYVELDPSWHNFKTVTQEQVLGQADGKPIVAPHTGAILFPKYLSRVEQQVLTTRPSELCRIMKRIKAEELPT